MLAPPASAPLAGRAIIIDGDTISLAGSRVRLVGIDAPELRQTCMSGSGAKTRCGETAARALAALVGKGDVVCSGEGTDAYDRLLAVCVVGGIDVNARMVETGQALAFVKYDSRYLAEERRAQGAGAGVWAGKFDTPWEWRRQVAADARLEIEVAGPGDGCSIKGNISRTGERIYHLPSQFHYAKTRIDSREGERMFCSESEALAAGWRRAVR